jgi:hypothetical protein
MIRNILRFFSFGRHQPTSRKAPDDSPSGEDLIVGYRLHVTFNTDVPLRYLRRSGEKRKAIPENETNTDSPYYYWLPEISSEFDFLDRGASASSAVGYVPEDGGDFLPYLISFREILERPRDLALREFDDVASRVREILNIPAGHGYHQTEKFDLSPNPSSGPNYHSKLWGEGSEHLASFVLFSISEFTYDGLTDSQLKALQKLGFGSIEEILNAPDSTLLSIPGIGPKRLAKIRVNRRVHGRPD